MKNWGNYDLPTVSVCCTAFNHENYITQAIESFLMQETNFPFEVIVRDDCSTDKTADIIREYSKQYPNIIKPILEVENQYSQGKEGSIKLVKKSDAKYIALCEGDDYWISPLKLQKQIDLLESNSTLKGVHTKVLYVDKDNNTLGQSDRVEKGFETIDYKYLAQRNTIHTCSFVFTKDIVDDNLCEMLREAPVGDLVYFLKTALSGNIGYVNELMSAYRKNIGISSHWKPGQSIQNVIKVYDIFNKKYAEIRPITNISKRYYYYKLSTMYAREYAYSKALYNYLLMLYFTKDTIFSKYFIVEKVNFSLYIKTFIMILPVSLFMYKTIKKISKKIKS